MLVIKIEWIWHVLWIIITIVVVMIVVDKYNKMKPCHNTTVPSTSTTTMHSNNLYQDINYVFQLLNNDNTISSSSSGDSCRM